MILFTSCRPLARAENLKAVYEACKCPKMFEQMAPRRDNLRHTASYDILVTDEIPRYSKAPVIMICHGASGGKTYGLDQPYPYVRKKDTELLTFVLSSSIETIPFVASWARCEEKKVLPIGMPRMDAYVGKKKGDGETFLAEYKRAYMYAPTYRTREEGGLPDVDWKWLDDHLEDDEILLVKLHPVTGDMLKLEGFRHIKAASAKEPSAQYLMDCDVLITDYSTIMFDGHVLRKPVVLFEKDWARYREKRGMSMAYPEMYSSHHCTDEKALLEMIRTAERTEKDEEIRKFVCGMCDGHATERVIRLINYMLQHKDGNYD